MKSPLIRELDEIRNRIIGELNEGEGSLLSADVVRLIDCVKALAVIQVLGE